MFKNNLKLDRLATYLPILCLLAWTISVAMTHSTGRDFRVKIVGFDPFDLISGHYLQFRYDLGPIPICQGTEANAPVCVCVKPNAEGVLEADKVLSCGDGPSGCDAFIRGSCDLGRFTTGSERYFFPEKYASVLKVVPEDSVADIRLNTAGVVFLRDIRVKSLTLLEYANLKLAGINP